MFKRYIASIILAAILAVQVLAAVITSNPTANQNPDAGQAGTIAVTTPSNTGHASTQTSAGGGTEEAKSCRWFTFQSVGGQITAITLKADHTSSGTLAGVSRSNTFRLQYSLNGGSSWTTAVERTNFTSSQGPTTFSVALSSGQDISQVQVRVFYQATSNDVGDAASVTATIANIKLEVTTADAQLVIMMDE